MIPNGNKSGDDDGELYDGLDGGPTDPARISEMERGQRPIIDAVVNALSHEMGGVGRERSE